MKKKICVLVTLLISIAISAQIVKDSALRKGKLFLTVGVEYRPGPLYSLSADFSNLAGATWINAQNSGAAFNYGFDFFVTKNLSLNFAHSMRNGLLTRRFTDSDLPSSVDAPDRVIISDFHFYADYHFQIFKKGELFVRVGKSLSNRGTSVFDRTSVFDQNGQFVGDITVTENYSYQPWNFALGYKKNGLSLTGGVYTSAVTNYFNDGNSFIVPYVGLKYNLFKF